MVEADAARQLLEQCGAVRARGVQELFQVPRFARPQRQPFGIEHHLDGLRAQIEAPVEPLATGEAEQHGLAARRCQRHHAGDHARVGGLRDLVVRQFVVAQVHRFAERACGLRKHLEARAVKRGVVGQIVPDTEQRDLLDVHRRLAGIREARPVQLARALAAELQVDRGFNRAKTSESTALPRRAPLEVMPWFH